LKRAKILVFFLLSSSLASAQLVVDDSYSAESLINDVLLGDGVEAENITINGEPGTAVSAQFGYFNATNSNIGLSTGIILASGGVEVAESPNDLSTAFITIPESEELDEEPDLEYIVSPAEINDVAVVEFDFTAKGDTLRFRYVFASEEYNEHTCSPYNDVFGFFISGPGIDPNPNFENNAQNVALVPGTNVPVAINTVNQGFAGQYGANAVCNAVSSNWTANSVYFVDNESNLSSSATQFDGFTVPMEVVIPVVCGATYHIKMAIADAVDDKNDSAVFIEAGSFSSEIPLTVDLEILNPDESGNAIEGCSSLKIDLERSDSIGVKTVYLDYLGLGGDTQILSELPDSVVFYHLDGHISFEVPLNANNTEEGFRNPEIHFLQPEVCSLDTAREAVPFPLRDFPLLQVAYPDTVALHCDESLNVNIEVSGGIQPYEIIWDSPDLEGFELSMDLAEETTFSAVVKDACTSNGIEIEILAYNIAYEELSIILPDEATYNCAEALEINPQVTGGYGDYTYNWWLDTELVSDAPVFSDVLVGGDQLKLEVLDRCVPGIVDSIPLSAMVNPIIVQLPGDTTALCTENVLIIPEVAGGFGDLSYYWKVNQVLEGQSSTFGNVYLETSHVRLEVFDECSQFATDDLFVFVDETPLYTTLPMDTSICKGERLTINPEVTGGHGDLTFEWNGSVMDDGAFSIIPQSSTTYTLKVTDECAGRLDHDILVDVQSVHAEFEFDYESSSRSVVNYSEGASRYEWLFSDGTVSSDFEPFVAAGSLENGAAQLMVFNEIGCQDVTRRDYDTPFNVFIPNAFSPDGNGRNDIFKAEGRGVASFEIWIYDRWGDLVFHSTDMSAGWDGTTPKGQEHYVQNSMFNYRFVAKSPEGKINEGHGTIQMIR
jgi:gliding motility-associated-like protein